RNDLYRWTQDRFDSSSASSCGTFPGGRLCEFEARPRCTMPVVETNRGGLLSDALAKNRAKIMSSRSRIFEQESVKVFGPRRPRATAGRSFWRGLYFEERLRTLSGLRA